jgi:hypothetical protein
VLLERVRSGGFVTFLVLISVFLYKVEPQKTRPLYIKNKEATMVGTALLSCDELLKIVYLASQLLKEIIQTSTLHNSVAKMSVFCRAPNMRLTCRSFQAS